MSSIHLDILDEKRQLLFEKLAVFAKQGTLAGGTGLALQIGHRRSYDFDIFFRHPITRTHVDVLRQVVTVTRFDLNTPDQVIAATGQGAVVTLLYYPFAPIARPLSGSPLPIASITDIAVDKAYTIGRRAVWRDYVDLYFLLAYKMVSIVEVINGAQKKFGVDFNPKLFLEQIVYFDDVEVTPISYIGSPVQPEKIQQYLQQIVRTYVVSEVSF